MRILGLAVGVLLAGFGLLGLAVPYALATVVSMWQRDPILIYVAALIRIVVGAILVFAAPHSRAPTVIRVFGALVVVGGLVTPFVGDWLGEVLQRLWSSAGPVAVRIWGGGALLVGLSIAYSMTRKNTDMHGR